MVLWCSKLACSHMGANRRVLCDPCICLTQRCCGVLGWAVAALTTLIGGWAGCYIKCRIGWEMHRLCATDWWRGVHAVVGLIVLAILSASVGLRATDDGNSFVQVTSPTTVQLVCVRHLVEFGSQGGFETLSKSLCSTVVILLGQRVVHVDLTCGGRLICTALCCLRVVLLAMVITHGHGAGFACR